MPISRIRLRLAAWFGAAFLLGLLVLDIGFLAYSRRKAEYKLTADVSASATSLSQAIRQERQERPGASIHAVVGEVMGEWPRTPGVILIYDASGRRIGARGDSDRVAALSRAVLPREPAGVMDFVAQPRRRFLIAWIRDTLTTRVTVVVATSTFRTHEDQEALIGWLALSVPLIGLGAAAAGYALARRALRPVQAMAEALDTIDPERIDRRLPTTTPSDELDHLAMHFNGLLDRLAHSRETSRRFLAQAAHQLRTPLTVVRGESSLGLDRPRTADDYRAALRRISLAAEQMSRRVNELFLLAEAEMGELPALTEEVDLDGLVLEAADLMRGRATGLGRSLEFGAMEDVRVTGAATLLREAVMELLENACRHGTAEQPVLISVTRAAQRARIEVSNAGEPIPDPAASGSAGGGPSMGLGLSIVRWVAEVHGGLVDLGRSDRGNRVTIDLPATLPDGRA
jgi:signal transduction histidine kinase